MKHLKTLLIALVVLGISASTAQAKEPFEVINALQGTRQINTALMSPSKTGKATYSSQEVEFLYVGGTELWLSANDGITEVTMNGLGSGQFKWTGANNRTFILDIADGDTAPFFGEIQSNGKTVGKFRVGKSKVNPDKAGGHWTGVLAFPGGVMMDVNLIVAGIGEDFDSTCNGGNLGARISFPGNAYQEATLLHCDDTFGENGGHNYSLSTLYSDSVTGETWFISLAVDVTEFGNLEGEVKAMNLTTLGGIHQGIAALARPTGFNL
jgi:hypothetical protein